MLLFSSLGLTQNEDSAKTVAEAENGSIAVLGNAHSLLSLQSSF